ncbi:MAG: V-type ATP synthase subunit D [Thermoplasmata archaeon]|nr:MAG: V-type ATP synthase subunit D [Thermoplasmata archaeon]
MVTEGLKPTRSELIQIKRKIKLSEMGHKLLKMKRDGLMYEFFEVLPNAKNIRTDLIDIYKDCHQKLAIAMAKDGKLQVKSVAHTQQEVPKLHLEPKNIMGVVVPSVKFSMLKKKLNERGYGIIGTSPDIDEVVNAYEKLVEQIIKAAEIETTIKRLLEEIDKTKRRVNALEFRVIPTLSEDASYITLRLEEIERENVFRLKRIKG